MKKPQMEVAKTLVEIGLSFDVIELMTQVTPVEYLAEVMDENESETNEKHCWACFLFWIPEGGEIMRKFHFIWEFLEGNRKRMAAMIILVCVYAFLNLCSPLLFSFMIDNVIHARCV